MASKFLEAKIRAMTKPKFSEAKTRAMTKTRVTTKPKFSKNASSFICRYPCGCQKKFPINEPPSAAISDDKHYRLMVCDMGRDMYSDKSPSPSD